MFLESKMKLYYLDDETLCDDYRTVFKDLKKMDPEKFLGTKSTPQTLLFLRRRYCKTTLDQFCFFLKICNGIELWTCLLGTSCTKSACRLSRHATLNTLVKQALGFLDLPSMLKPRRLYRPDDKRPYGVTMIPWEIGKLLVWDVADVNALAPSRLNQGSLCNLGTDAEEHKIQKYCE